jgi:hypothetical protein
LCITTQRNKRGIMFNQILNQQGAALESLMARQSTSNPHLMDEARAELKSAINKAIRATTPPAPQECDHGRNGSFGDN